MSSKGHNFPIMKKILLFSLAVFALINCKKDKESELEYSTTTTTGFCRINFIKDNKFNF